MTIHHMTLAKSSLPTALSALRPLTQPRSLTHEIVERLATEIAAGKLKPGERLPTEQEMMAALGVSRTVIREAVSALRAEGLVVTRQGVGAFVASEVSQRPFRIDAGGLASIGEVLNIMELRMGLEIEAAGLAAARGSAAQKKRIGAALHAIDAAMDEGNSAIDQDFAFHRAIAEATGNPQFARFLEFLGRFIIPRRSIHVSPGGASDQDAYLAMIQDEHRAIFTAIHDGDSVAARVAMRNHLGKSCERYRRLAAGSDG
jgi:GntR family transcriptional regulator, transcriptional repressor for pyruvate dehydrogenase complex